MNRDPTQLSTLPVVLPEDLKEFSWERVFGNDRPVEIEIGSGKGGFLLRRAAECPELNLLGIEWANEFYRHAADRMRRRGVPNVRLLRTDASQFMKTICPPASIVGLHLYHPDPWPKRRHHRRRIVHEEFVDAVERAIRPGGFWRIQTDHAEYFEIIRATLSDHAAFTDAPWADAPTVLAEEGSAHTEESAGTNFEVKYRREGRQIYRLALRRA